MNNSQFIDRNLINNQIIDFQIKCEQELNTPISSYYDVQKKHLPEKKSLYKGAKKFIESSTKLDRKTTSAVEKWQKEIINSPLNLDEFVSEITAIKDREFVVKKGNVIATAIHIILGLALALSSGGVAMLLMGTLAMTPGGPALIVPAATACIFGVAMIAGAVGVLTITGIISLFSERRNRSI